MRRTPDEGPMHFAPSLNSPHPRNSGSVLIWLCNGNNSAIKLPSLGGGCLKYQGPETPTACIVANLCST